MSFHSSDSDTQDMGSRDRERILHFRNLAPGEVFAGRYRIIAAIGHGGSGEVYRVADVVADQELALKILFPGSSATTLERLRRELRLVRELHHPGILHIHDIGAEDGLLYLVSELLEGESLKERLAREGRLSPAVATGIVRGLLEALAVAHEAGVVHRDVKPANIFLVPDGCGGDRVVLLDFGLAREASGEGLTTVGRFVGTPEYSAPEQIRGQSDIGPATDLYAVGVTAWQMIAGWPPFSGASEIEVMNAHLQRPPPSPRRSLGRVPVALRAMILRLLEKDPRRRPCAREALDCLDRGGWGALSGLRYYLGRLGRQRVGLRVMALAAFLVVSLAVAAWALDPVTAIFRGTELTVLTRGGLQLRRQVPGQPIGAVTIGSTGFGPLRRLWVAKDFPPLPPPDGRPPGGDRGLWAASSVLLPFHQAIGPNWLNPWSTPYPGLDGVSHVRCMASLAHLRRGGEPVLAVVSRHSPGYPSRLMLVYEDGSVGGNYHHPGHLALMRGFRHPRTDELYLAVAGFNNLAGPRQVVAGLPASVLSRGQAPPFTASVARFFPAGGWYTFLPHLSRSRAMDLRVERGVVRVGVAGAAVFRLDAATGVPLEKTVRGGLSVPQWQRRREALLAALYRAEGRAQAGGPEQGARILDEFGKSIEGPAEMVSIAFYRAALLHMKSAAAGVPAAVAYREALASIEGALAAEALPQRYRLLHAELLMRLGRTAEVERVLADWGEREEEPMYAYEYLLLGHLNAGRRLMEGPLPERIIAVAHGSWRALATMAIAYEQGQWEVCARTWEELPATWRARWDLHNFWYAQCLLDRPDPDPRGALEHLGREATAGDSGMEIPMATARLLAHALLGETLDSSAVRRAEEEVARFETHAAWDLHALYMRRLARRNLARARASRISPP